MRRTMFIAIAASLTVSAPLAAKTATPAKAELKEDKAGNAGKKICKRLATSGSRMEERVCLTKEEWKQVEKEVAG